MKCYLCGSETRPLFRKNNYQIVRCTSCGLAATVLGAPYEDFVEQHYTKGYFTGDPKRSAYVDYKNDKKIIVRNLQKFLTEVQKHKSTGKLLDVGCALGFFVELAQKNGFDAYGFDASNYAVEEARKTLGSTRIQHGTISRVRYPAKTFDIITMFDIFEHLANPREDLRRLNRWLKDDGVIIIATGDTDSYLARHLGRRWTFYIPPQHLFFFNKKTLTSVLLEQQFKPIKWFRIGKWLSFRYILHLARTTGESVFAGRLYARIEKSRLGRAAFYVPAHDNMVVIAKKA